MIWKVIGAAFGLGFAAVGVVESGLGERVSLALSQPEGCPEGGCRVGYRFKDGGIAPEGWEPYETDDPVVALMDACLTHLMTGTLTEYSALRVEEDQSSMIVRIEPLAMEGGYPVHESQMTIRNLGYDRRYRTFSCSGNAVFDQESWQEVLEWVNGRFVDTPEWKVRRTGYPRFDAFWGRNMVNEDLDVYVSIASRSLARASDGEEAPAVYRRLSVNVYVRYRGPAGPLLGGRAPDIVF